MEGLSQLSALEQSVSLQNLSDRNRASLQSALRPRGEGLLGFFAPLTNGSHSQHLTVQRDQPPPPEVPLRRDPEELVDRAELELLNEHLLLTNRQEYQLAHAIGRFLKGQIRRPRGAVRSHNEMVEMVRRKCPRVFYKAVKSAVRYAAPSTIAISFRHTVDD